MQRGHLQRRGCSVHIFGVLRMCCGRLQRFARCELITDVLGLCGRLLQLPFFSFCVHGLQRRRVRRRGCLSDFVGVHFLLTRHLQLAFGDPGLYRMCTRPVQQQGGRNFCKRMHRMHCWWLQRPAFGHQRVHSMCCGNLQRAVHGHIRLHGLLSRLLRQCSRRRYVGSLHRLYGRSLQYAYQWQLVLHCVPCGRVWQCCRWLDFCGLYCVCGRRVQRSGHRHLSLRRLQRRQVRQRCQRVHVCTVYRVFVGHLRKYNRGGHIGSVHILRGRFLQPADDRRASMLFVHNLCPGNGCSVHLYQ